MSATDAEDRDTGLNKAVCGGKLNFIQLKVWCIGGDILLTIAVGADILSAGQQQSVKILGIIFIPYQNRLSAKLLDGRYIVCHVFFPTGDCDFYFFRFHGCGNSERCQQGDQQYSGKSFHVYILQSEEYREDL